MIITRLVRGNTKLVSGNNKVSWSVVIAGLVSQW